MPVPLNALDEIVVPYPVEAVWAVVSDFAGYPAWWPVTVRARVAEVGAGAEGEGTDLEIRPFGGPGFRCRVEEVEAPRRIGMRYHRGPVLGGAEWILEPVPAGTRVAYRLDAEGHGPLVALGAWLLDLRRLHSWQMRGVLRGLLRELAARDAARPG